MSQFDSSVKKIIKGIFFQMPGHLTPIQPAKALEARRKLVIGYCGERITLQ
jgi:hypothetical protein